ncbi:MAG: NAD(P)H-dependent flavin oxidoreductase [Candidatus Hermodarchaeota archaeon]
MIKTQITEMLGIKHPIITAPMGPFYTTELTIAASEAGGLGVLSHTYLFGKSSTNEMKKTLEYVVEYTDKPFGFNIRTARMQMDAIKLCREIPKFIMNNPKLREQVRYVVTSAGSSRMLQKSKNYQKLKEISEIKNFHVAPAFWLARKCVDAGVDGVVITGIEGGGHQSYEQVSTLVLIQQFKQAFPDFPLIACGGFATGVGLAGAIAMGAGAIAMGTRFIASNQCEFHSNYKEIVPPAKASDTTLVTGFLAPIRLWKNNYTAHHDLVSSKEEKVKLESEVSLEEFIEDQKRYEAVYYGDVENGVVPLGQSCGIIYKLEDVKNIIENTVSEAERYLENSMNKIKQI